MKVTHEYNELTESEKYLTHLCKHTFLNLWSWPHIYRNQRWNGGEGKEVCDLLVVFENNIIIFSDKYCKFPNTGDLILDWSRWFKKAVYKSARQILGAERWIRQYPDMLYLDKNCTTPFPIDLPTPEESIFHRIVVAHGCSNRCQKELGGSGSLMINPHVVGKQHFDTKSERVVPFMVGNIDENKGFVHVLDDFTLNIVLKTVDTISDFICYLAEKQRLFESGKQFMAAGEEELLAYYLQKMNENGKHYIEYPQDFDFLSLDQGLWEEYQENPGRLAQLEVDKASYAWDRLIDTYSKHVLDGTLYISSSPKVSDHEIALRFLAKEPRTRRRMLANSLFAVMERANHEIRSARVIQSQSQNEPYYVFLALERKKNGSLDEYRTVRKNLLSSYCRVTKLKFPEAKHIIGIATEPLRYGESRSEDLAYLNATDWDEEEERNAREIQKEMNLLNKVKEKRSTTSEYPLNQMVQFKKGRMRNKPCFCGSGKKYKKCCGKIE
jgi:hypothetical protein